MTDKNMCGTSCSLGSSKLIALLSLVAVAVLVFLALSNWQPTNMQLFSATRSAPLGALILISLIIGFFAGISDYLSLGKAAKQDQIKDQWQVQDAKLAASITSDREKQLEAKISTLEIALDKALKKE